MNDDFKNGLKNYTVFIKNGKYGNASVHLQKNSSMKIFVAGLPYDLDDAELEEIFEKFGKVVTAKVVMDKETGKSKGFGFVDMPDKTEAMQTIELLHGVGIKGKKISVQRAEEKNGNDNYRSREGFNKRY